MYNKDQIKKIVRAYGGINTMENAIGGEIDYQDDGIYPEGHVFEGQKKVKKVFIPFTDSAIWSNWRIAIRMKHNGEEVYVWFRLSLHKGDEEVTYWVDQVWKPGIGRKMRRDGVWNLRKKMENRAGMVRMIEHSAK